MRKQPAVTEQTKANLRHAFWILYREKPIEKITVREITDRAGYNRATFYLYFHDVYDLFAQIEETILADVRRLVDDGLMQEETLDFTHHMGRIAELAERYEHFMPQLMGPHGDPSFEQRIKQIISPLLDRFILPADGLDEQQRAILREFYLSGLLAAIQTWVESSPRMPIDRLIELIVATVLHEGGRSA